MNEIKVKVRFYGMIAEQVGFSEEDIIIPENLSIIELIDQRYMTRFQGKNFVSSYAVNDQFSTKDKVICNGDVLDLMPPFAGG